MSRTTLFADVILPLAVPNLYTYRVPFEMNALVKPGIRVLVQFGKTKLYTAIVKQVHENPPKQYEAKYIDSLLDEYPQINEKQFRLWDWISHYYMCFPGEVMNAALPAGLKLNSELRVVMNEEFDLSAIDAQSLSDREYLVAEALQVSPVLSLEEIGNILQVKNVQPVIRSLIAKKIVVAYEEVKEKYKPRLVSYIKLANTYVENEEELRELFGKLEKRAYKQLEVLLFYLDQVRSAQHADKPEALRNSIRKSEVLKKSDAAALQALIKKNVFVQEDIETGRLEYESRSGKDKALSEEQLKAVEQIKEEYVTKDVCLLHGVTGSGKTEVYCRLIAEALEQGKQVLYLVPEIALTTQLIYRIQQYFGDRAGVYHSRFTENERVEVWNSVLNQETNPLRLNQKNYQVILGARSALFLPYSNLGLIVVDEEHDASYKQYDPAPRYNARDAAIFLASVHKAKVLLGSATPCLETYYNAMQHKYGFVELASRYGNASMPDIEVADTKTETEKKTMKSLFTSKLVDAVSLTLAKKEQAILFQNRRGFAPYTECQTCGWTPMCVQCDVSLIYHKASNKLSCHYCGYTISPPSACAACGSPDLKYKGFGTEKIEEEVELLFPEARIARMDLDSTRSKYAYRQLIDEFESGNIDILVGTQMVTKGLDFDHVSLVGVLNADQMLNFPDFRAFERSYQLMAQVSGRAGRKEKKGKVIVQTTQPDHVILKQVMQNDYTGFYQLQLQDRKEFHYPPFYRIIEFTLVSKDLDLLNYASEQFGKSLRASFAERVLGPEFPLVAKIRNEFHKRIILKTERDFSSQRVREILNGIVSTFRSAPDYKAVKLHIDVDPI